MGLDMHLEATKYVSSSDYLKTQDKFNELVKVMEAENFVGGFVPSMTVSASVAYWRKVNQVHQWFVDNYAGGEDDCRTMYVGREGLERLLEICKQLDASNRSEDLALELLPPQSGFFFGGTEIDDWYWESISDTIEQIEKCLKDVPEDWDFEYHASW